MGSPQFPQGYPQKKPENPPANRTVAGGCGEMFVFSTESEKMRFGLQNTDQKETCAAKTRSLLSGTVVLSR